jgi:Na+/H+-dicarboxylate symporter
VLGLALGLIVGLVWGEQAAPLAKLGTAILDLIKALAAPLLVFAVLDAFLRTEVRARSGGVMVAIALTNAAIAVTIGLTISNVLQPGRSLQTEETRATARAAAEYERMAGQVEPQRRIDFLDDLLRFIPASIARPFLDNQLISIILLAVLAGSALRRVKHEQIEGGQGAFRAVEDGVATAYRAAEVVIGWVVQLVPLAVFGVVATTVGKYGLSPLRGLAVYLGVGLLGLAIQALVVYPLWLLLVARRSPRWFWTGSRDAVVYAMGTGSSLATLPVTLRCLDRMGVSPPSARMAACVGTNLNNDGILLYEAMAVLFVAQACGITLSIEQQLIAASACVIAGIGISGIPEAGLISLLLVLKTVRQVPDAAIAAVVPLLLTVDWILGRARAMTNVTSDILVAVLLDRLAPPPEPPTLE